MNVTLYVNFLCIAYCNILSYTQCVRKTAESLYERKNEYIDHKVTLESRMVFIL